jgi:hypothetical protein
MEYWVAVGTALASGPPHRSQRAELPHWAPASGSGGEAHLREGMHHAGAVHPTSQYTNLNLLVSGLPVSVKTAHAKIRRTGYGRNPVADNGK